ncbi:UDP-glycosyltransferase 73C1-like [Momordica charantia]|uniref:UDP-glycosyltransferase 73C1-like n=1 Tax=Momordica charantia TaxID=3673 RepID=A0A6J1CSV3_MOMCH|nr:UDP-glycosyltransferase 73C1-like [Momordica charantia]
MAMASPHFVLFPFMAQGHMIPMIDLAKLLARRGAIISFITTPRNAARNYSVLARAINSGLRIHVHQLDFPSNQVGLPEGCENLDLLPSYDDHLTSKFFQATFLLREPWEKLVEQLIPRPTCIITDTGFPWTLPLSLRLHIPRLVYYTHSCLYLLIMRSIQSRQPLLASISDDSEYVTLSDLPHAVQTRGDTGGLSQKGGKEENLDVPDLKRRWRLQRRAMTATVGSDDDDSKTTTNVGGWRRHAWPGKNKVAGERNGR